MNDKSFLLTESWCALVIAILFGVLGTLFLKLSDCFHRFKPTLAMAFFYSISFAAMTFALKSIDVSVVYGIWSGAGTILMMIMSVYLFNEKLSFRKIFFLFVIVIGIIGTQSPHGFHFFSA